MARSENQSSTNMKINDQIEFYRKQISNYRKSSTHDLEFEIRFGNRDVEITQPIHENIFRDLVHRGFNVESSKYTLKTQLDYSNPSISTKTQLDYSNTTEEFTQKHDVTEVSKLSKIRVEIEDLPSIQTTCNNNILPDGDNVQYVLKRGFAKDKKFLQYNNDFAYRSSIQEEVILDKNRDPDVAKIKKDWVNEKKLFRYIHRTSLTNDAFPNIRIDLSIVKNNYNNKQISFTNARVLDGKSYFEVEVELVDINNDTDFDSIKINLKKVIKYILCSMQGTPYPVSFKELNNVIKNYYIITGQSTEYDKTGKIIKNSKQFIGPSSQTLQKVNIVKDESIKGICVQDDFGVTDKADGIRKILFITSEGKLYFIDQNMNVQFTGRVTKETKIFNTIIDGEYITTDKFGNKINYFAAFDVYFIKKKDYREFKFHVEEDPSEGKKEKTRYGVLKTVIKLINNVDKSSITAPSKNHLDIDRKAFYFTSNKRNITIFNCCQTILSKINRSEGYIYTTDGLIFTSQILGVTQEFPGDKIKEKKYSWKHSFKWKPPEYNTIDFLVKVKRDNKNELDKKTKEINGQIKQYYELILHVGFDQKRHGNKQLDILRLKHEQPEYFESSKIYRPEPFHPSNPSDENAHICHVPLTPDENGNLSMYTTENEIMVDDTIVEFSYDIDSKDKFMKWIPLRVRHDKTSEYRSKERSNYGNAYHVANNNWQSIHDPITEEMLSIENILKPEDIQESEKDVYYNGSKIKSQTQNLRDFHNKVVKKMLIEYTSDKSPKPLLLDLAVGKAGDLNKWINSKIHGVLGIDLSKDNIYNKIDGACARFISSYSYRDSKSIPICMFIQGNSGKLLHDGSFIKDEENSSRKIVEIDEIEEGKQELEEDFEQLEKQELSDSDMKQISLDTFNALTGTGDKEKQHYAFLNKYFNMFGNKFDICSIQFALHYMFQDKITLHNFMVNVSNYVKLNGYFIGTCYDGKIVYDMLKDTPINERIEKYANKTHKVWHVTKKYNDEEHSFDDNDETSLSMKIGVYQESINKEFDEYLVNFKYFANMMEQYGFVLEKQFQHKGKQFDGLGSFENIYKSLGSKIKMTEEEKFVSFLNKYFIFRKVRNVDTRLLYNYFITQDSELDEINLTIQKAVKTNKKIKLV